MIKIGFIGLGKMGLPLAQRIVKSGEPLCVFDLNKDNVKRAVRSGAVGCLSISELADKLAKPKVIFLCVPAGKSIDLIVKQLGPHLAAGDTLIDLGNSFYQATQVRAKKLKQLGVTLIDVGVSGGVAGARSGACLMIGGDAGRVARLDKLFKSLSNNGSYRYVGRSGAGHFVKGFHNLIEYGYLQALAEGLASCAKLGKRAGLTVGLEELCDLWSQGSIIESRLVTDAKKAFQVNPRLLGIAGTVHGQTSGEMKKLIKLAKQAGVKPSAGEAAIKARINSRHQPTESGKIINAIRQVFGGHQDWNM
jgi:6-phosphogluconate dehydrogenase